MKSLLATGNGEFDITFLVGSSMEEVNAHKLILKTHSTVFSKIFSNLKEGLKQQVRVEIPDATPAEFRLFLEVSYSANSIAIWQFEIN